MNEVRQFLGLSNYFRKFSRGYAATASPLSDLLKGLSKRERASPRRQRCISALDAQAMTANFSACWSSACDVAFASIKRALMSAPVVTLSDSSKHFTLVSDACEQPPAVGAVLLQDGHPVSFFSRKLSGPELNYSASDIEMLAVICALRDWRCYLEGAKFTIVTDHQPNTYLDVASSAHTLKRRARWLDAACGYDYVWCYRAGRLNVEDPVSRAPQHVATLPPTALLALQVARHTASTGKLPTPRCCILCALKSNRLACHSFTRDAEANGVTCRARGLHISDGGGGG